ncbi:hypothetical protein BWI17_02375 [Betaproteobacteria bacterium GR16-43]|nr:hypothetical protein BWI17_02375 [Betaproteobacteria bacterium GR16-43]
MPWTLSHAAAVLPLRRWCRGPLSFAGLVAGSFAPDAGYYVLAFDVGTFAHTPAGSVLACVPIGLALVLALHALRQSWCFLLPQPHRGAIATHLDAPMAPLLVLIPSIVIGAWTHIAWDACTHGTGWVVEALPYLKTPMPGTTIGFYHVLQELSTIVGAAILVVAYRRWLRSVPAGNTPNHADETDGQRWRILVAIGCGLIAAAIASILAADYASAFSGAVAVRTFLFRGALHGTLVLAVLYTLVAVGVHAWRSR